MSVYSIKQPYASDRTRRLRIPIVWPDPDARELALPPPFSGRDGGTFPVAGEALPGLLPATDAARRVGRLDARRADGAGDRDVLFGRQAAVQRAQKTRHGGISRAGGPDGPHLEGRRPELAIRPCPTVCGKRRPGVL